MWRAGGVPSEQLAAVAQEKLSSARIVGEVEFPDGHVLRAPRAAIVRLEKKKHAHAARILRRAGNDVRHRADCPAELSHFERVAVVEQTANRFIDAHRRHGLDPAAARPLRSRLPCRRDHHRFRCAHERAIVGNDERRRVQSRCDDECDHDLSDAHVRP